MSDYDALGARPRLGGVVAFDHAQWQSLAGYGFLSLGLPESYGGIGGPAEIALVCEEFGRGPILLPFASTAILASRLVASAGNDQQCGELLPSMAAGETVLAVAHREGGAARRDSYGPTVAKAKGAGYVLRGRKRLVEAAEAAHLFIVSASMTDDSGTVAGESLFLVDPGQPGVEVTLLPLVDGTRCGEILLHDVEVAGYRRLGREGEGNALLQDALRYATLASGSEMAGLAAQSLNMTLEYLKTREQFGVPLASFQALRHKAADMLMDCETGQAAVLKAVASFQDPGGHDPAMAASLVRVVLSDIGCRVSAAAIQLHGAVGLTEEAGVGRYFKRATLIRTLFGSRDANLAEYARLMTVRAVNERIADEVPTGSSR